MITPAQRAEIRRLYFGEHWKIGTIAAALGVHHETVRAALQHETGGLRRGVSRPSALDPFLPFIRDTLTQYPRLRATRLHEMLRLRGYPGSAVQVRRLVRRLRPQTATHVYRRVVTLAGEQAQVDWGTFGTVRIGHGMRAVSGFVMVLGYSRALFALFTLDQTLESFLRGHVAAFEALDGSARTLVYDNLRSAVLDRGAPPGLARVQADVQRALDAGEVRLPKPRSGTTRPRRAGRGSVEANTVKPLSKNPGAIQSAATDACRSPHSPARRTSGHSTGRRVD